MTHKKKGGSGKKVAAAAAIGVAAGVAAALLSNKENRDKVAKTAGDMKDSAVKHGKEIQKSAQSTLKDAQKEIM